mmetsp:Transcript_42070/g.64493  ORF Transcript_42070/g.64493 Transcript_42070/m.64493 type:complete len:113 (+) Transcript_42070:1577-1915(+)
MYNDIYDNSDGIILFDSCNHISRNRIHENQRCGVICSGSSFPEILHNHIFGNNQTGITIRDNSRGDIKANELFANFYQLSMVSASQKEQEQLEDENKIVGNSEYTSSICNIF